MNYGIHIPPKAILCAKTGLQKDYADLWSALKKEIYKSECMYFELLLKVKGFCSVLYIFTDLVKTHW